MSSRILRSTLFRSLGPRLYSTASTPSPPSAGITSSSKLTPSVSSIPVFFNSVNSGGKITAFRVLDGEGNLMEGVDKGEDWVARGLKELPKDVAVKMYETMLLLPTLDSILYNSQRQGKLSFYMTSHGEEGAVVGSAAAWSSNDEVFAQYREVGVLLWRGFPFSTLLGQVFGSSSDNATSGRQMPVHYNSAPLKFHPVRSPLATQIPQAAGAAFAIKREREAGRRAGDIVVCYMGDGAASEGDFHAGLNMASVIGGPCIFFIRNNGFAISTPVSEQYAGDGIASRGPGYGMETIRVDGNDPLAVYLASKEAKRRAVEGCKPVMIEALTYRVGHHSTSDDSSAYRTTTEVDSWKKLENPLFRFRKFLEHPSRSWWSQELEDSTRQAHRKQILKEFVKTEKERKPELNKMFTDVYESEERNIREQREELRRLVLKWGDTKEWKSELERYEGGKAAFLKSFT